MSSSNEHTQAQCSSSKPAVNEKTHATSLEAAKDLKERTPPAERNSALRDLLDIWGLPSGLQALAKTYGEYYADLARCLEVPSGKPVLPGETIITYYQALTGGGIENVQLCLIEIWKQLGYHVVIALEEEPPQDVSEKLGAPIYLIPPASAANYAERATAWEELLEKTNASAIVYHKWLCRVFLWDLLLMKHHDVSFICHTHGVFSHSMHNGDLLFAHLAPAYSLCDALVTLSSTDRYFWSHFNDHVYETINPIGLDIQKMTPSVNPKNHNILWLARISPEKGAENALLVFKEVLNHVPDATLSLVGTAASASYQQTIEQLVRSLGIEDRINMPGWTNDQKTYYQNADAFLMTSTDEGFALTLAESRYYGTPCVMFDLPTLTIRGKELGIQTVPQGDITAAAEALSRLLLDEQRNATYRAAAQNGYRKLYEDFDFAGLWHDIFCKIERPVYYDAPMRDAFFFSIYEEASFHYTCGIRARNERINLFAKRAEAAELQIKKLSDEIQVLSHENQKLSNRVQRLADKSQRLASEKLERNARIAKLKDKLKKEQEAQNRLKSSASWKIGRALTAIPRKVRRLFSK